MTVNPHIKTAIEIYAAKGIDFHEIVTWHLLHGFVLSSPEFLCVGHYCQGCDITLALSLAESNMAFITFMAGSMSELKAFSPNGLKFIAFERFFKNNREIKAYEIGKFLTLIH